MPKLEEPVKLVPKDFRILLAQTAAVVDKDGSVDDAVQRALYMLHRCGLEEDMPTQLDS